MLKVLGHRLRQGLGAAPFTVLQPELPDRFRGRPALDARRCVSGCEECASVCPTAAIAAGPGILRLDLGRCLFCGECASACPTGAVEFGRDHRLSARSREHLVLESGAELRLAEALDTESRRLFGRSLQLRQVSAGGCNGCEVEVNVLQTVVFDLGRFGIRFVSSPRHADGLLITGPLTANMREALAATWEAVPSPKLVVAVGACAISGGPYVDHPETSNGVAAAVAVDLFIPGCPPHPWTILDGLVRLLGRL